jgi:hypothetical protein
VLGPNKAERPLSHEITSSGSFESPDHCLPVFGLTVLKKRPLHFSLFPALRYMDGLSGHGIDTCPVDAGRRTAGGRDKILNLLGLEPYIPKKLRELHGILQLCPGMGGDEIGNEILFFPKPGVHYSKGLHKPFIDFPSRFSHNSENICRNMFGGDLELAAHVMGAEFLKKRRFFVREKIVEPYAGPYEHFLYSGERSEFSKKL